MPSTFLQLTNKVLVRINETPLDAGNFASARGINATAKGAVIDTVNEINQAEEWWPFNVATGTQLLTVGLEEYTWPADLLVPDWYSFYIQKDAALNTNTKPLLVINRNDWMRYGRQEDYDAETTGVRRPENIFPSEGGFGVTPSPDKAYTVNFKYYKVPTEPSADDDLVTIPTNYDYVIVFGALAKMNLFKDNPQGQQISNANYENALKRMKAALITRPDNLVNTMTNPGNVRNYSSVGYWTGF